MTQAVAPEVPGRILVQDVRASFTEGIWVASTPPNTTGEPAYNMQAILPPDHPQVPALVALIQWAANKQWKEKAAAVLTVAQAAGKIFLRNGNDKPYDGYAGNLYISCRSKQKPKVYQGKREVDRAGSSIYSGCRVNLLIDIFPYIRGSNGVGAGFKGVQFLRDDQPLGGGAPARAEEFGDVQETAQATAEFGALFGVQTPAGSVGFKL
jgi:hypothetical protein